MNFGSALLVDPEVSGGSSPLKRTQTRNMRKKHRHSTDLEDLGETASLSMQQERQVRACRGNSCIMLYY